MAPNVRIEFDNDAVPPYVEDMIYDQCPVEVYAGDGALLGTAAIVVGDYGISFLVRQPNTQQPTAKT